MPSFELLFGALTNVSNKGRLPKNGRTNEKTERASSFRRRLSASKGRKKAFLRFACRAEKTEPDARMDLKVVPQSV